VSEPLVQINNVSKRFGKNQPLALNDISVVIPKGQIVGLAGPDGAGKTTLIRLIAGLLKPTQGTITVDDNDTIKSPEPIHTITSYMPQKFGLYEDLTVEQNLALYADLRGVVCEERKQIFTRLLAFTDLGPFTKRLAGALSGGMKQKLGLACALVRTPALLLLDEPSVGVDPISRRELWKMVKNLLSEGVSVLWSTAYLDEAERCDTVLLLNEGKLLYSGKPSGITERVQGRTFKISGIEGSRRLVLMNALNQDNVMDGIIQGKDVRIVVKKYTAPLLDLAALKGGSKLVLNPVPPRFEDAFIDILGGGPKGISLLAEQMPQVASKYENAIEAKGMTKCFGSFVAADNVTFTVKRGEIFGLLGPNGAGKTTTFKMLCGMLKPTSGEPFVNGIDLQKAPSEARSHIGYMAQKFSLYGDLSVRQNLTFFSGVYNLSGKEQLQAMDRMIAIFNFKHCLEESAFNLSLGYKQRLALSCAVMHHPSILFLDEPTSGVDPITRREFWSHINGLVEKGVTVMVTTHFMDEAEYCDRIALVYRGKIINIGTPDDLKQHAVSKENSDPTLEDAFVQLIEQFDVGSRAK